MKIDKTCKACKSSYRNAVLQSFHHFETEETLVERIEGCFLKARYKGKC